MPRPPELTISRAIVYCVLHYAGEYRARYFYRHTSLCRIINYSVYFFGLPPKLHIIDTLLPAGEQIDAGGAGDTFAPIFVFPDTARRAAGAMLLYTLLLYDDRPHRWSAAADGADSGLRRHRA